MPPSPRARSRTPAPLRRRAVWLYLVLVVQGVAAALASGKGLLHLQVGPQTAHVHDAPAGHVHSADRAHAHGDGHAAHHPHDGAECHHHTPQDDLLPLQDTDAAGAAAFVAAAWARAHAQAQPSRSADPASTTLTVTGPCFAASGDFASAGSADIVYLDAFDAPFAQLTLGQGGYRSGVAGGSATG